MSNASNLTVNAIRVLSVEAIQKAKSGHPGLPLGAAPIGYSVFKNMVFNPKNTSFDNRDRFVLSAGHGSMLAYSLYHLFGFKLSIDDIKNFRQLGSKAAGHPEYGICPGVETSTGPLGQGIANAVGMAIAETYLANKFNKDGFPIVDHYTYAICGDGCLQEGIAYEASSLAGNLKLGKLIVLYDDNNITIEGNTNITFTEDVAKRQEALGWQVLKVADANDLGAIDRAIKKAKLEKDKPTLIMIKSVIGFGTPLAGNSACHGAPIGEDNIKILKENLGWDYPEFTVPKEVYSHCKRFATRGKNLNKAWDKMFDEYAKVYPELAKEYLSWQSREIPNLMENEDLFKFDKEDASRSYGNIVLNKLSDIIPNLIGGSADLAPANKSYMKGKGDFSADDRAGRNMHFGIREHAMCAITNGMYLHGGLIPYCATFAIFSDYMKNAMRMSALMELPVYFILTHDSIGVGEDGPTHQPIEQLAGLRAMPNLHVYRPANGVETACAWINALNGKHPSAFFLSRQTLKDVEGISKDAVKGGYIVKDSDGKPDLILIGTGSELSLCDKARDELVALGYKVRLVSMPCIEDFEKQPKKYRESVLPASVRARVAVEAGATATWYKYVGLDGKVVGIDRFGESAPAGKLFDKFGFTVENVVETAKSILK